MSWIHFWQGLNASDKRQYATDCGSSYESMTTGYVYGRRTPRIEKLALMVKASNNSLSIEEVVEHFVAERVRKEVQRLQKEENPVSGA